MDFDIAGLLANPDFQYMLAGIGAAGGQAYNNPFAQAVGGITQQGIGAKNQAALLARLLGQGGKGGGFGVNDSEKRLQEFLKANPENKMTNDGSKITLSGVPSAFDSFIGGGGSPTPSATPSSGGQSSILNPSVGLPGDLSGLSLAGLKPDDVNKAITLGLTGADLERKKVSDLIQSKYYEELIAERRAARGAKDVSAPIGDGLSLAQFNAYPSDVKAHLYANHLRKQSGQAPISFEQFKQQSDTNSTMQLIDRANRDPEFKKGLMEYKQAGATNINLGDKAALQRQTNAINNFDALKKPDNAKLFEPTKEENSKLIMEHGIPGDPTYDKALVKFKINKALALVKGTGVTILEKEAKIEGNELVIPVITKTGAKDVIRRTIK
jgi:hypothetical protein